MYLACVGIIPPKQWEHDPEIDNDYQLTVAMLLS